ncbi:MAG: CDP-alcohol phosphatidyltransferase family protein [Desulfurococcaceae archaeon]
MLNKLRNKLDAFMGKLALKIAGSCIPVDPNAITISSLIILLVGLALLLLTGASVVFSLFILISGFMDVLDGAIARAMNKVSMKGAFLDSTIDKVNEIIIAMALLYLGFDPIAVLLFLALSLLISYIRARAEALKLVISGIGLMERAERLIGIVAILVINTFNHDVASLMLYVLLVLMAFTVIERMVFVLKRI